MPENIQGIHHITGISGPPQDNYDFYTGKLGLRFIKKTINFDDPKTYHLYYGNYRATPGSSITFFPRLHLSQGSPAAGEVTTTCYSIPVESAGYWRKRLNSFEIEHNITEEFGRFVIHLRDNDNALIKLVEDADSETLETRGYAGVPDSDAIRGIFGAEITIADRGRTSELLEEFGWKNTGMENNSYRMESESDNNLGRVIDLIENRDLNGEFGFGSVHHIAFRVKDESSQQQWREKLIKMSFEVTEARDRVYFQSIYFREPGGVLFEIATDGPGFDKDEPLEMLGEKLKLPPWFEKNRNHIENLLPELETPYS
jgi:glyoxalase family protein